MYARNCRALLAAGVALVAAVCLSCERGDVDAGTCADCTIELTPEVVFRFDSSTIAPVYGMRMAVNQAQTLFVLFPGLIGAELLVLDRTGTIVKTVGRRGSGPGEIMWVNDLVFDRTDSLWVFDRDNLRASVYSPDVEYVRSVPVAGRVNRVKVTDANELFVQGTPRRPEAEGSVARLLARDGTPRYVGFFDSAPDDEDDWMSPVTGHDETAVWVGMNSELRLMLYPATGGRSRPLREIRRSPAWINGPTASKEVLEVFTLRPTVLDIHRRDSTLWVLGVGLSEEVTKIRLGPGEQLPEFTPEQIKALSHMIIEVVNPNDGSLYTSRMLHMMPPRFIGRDLLYVYDVEASGEPVITVYRYAMARRGP